MFANITSDERGPEIQNRYRTFLAGPSGTLSWMVIRCMGGASLSSGRADKAKVRALIVRSPKFYVVSGIASGNSDSVD